MFGTFSRVASTLLLLCSPFIHAETLKVLDTDFPDPSVIEVDGNYFAFATTGNGVNAQIAWSADFIKWIRLEGVDAMPDPFPAWVAEKPHLYAPEVIRRDDGVFVMYYAVSISGHPNGDKHCVGAATATDITGPYKAEDKPLVCPDLGAIDAATYKEGDDYYILYKVNGYYETGTPLMLQPLNRDAITTKGDPIFLIDRDERDGPDIEAPSLHKAGDTYFLTFSSNVFDSPKYDVSWAWSPALKGPYHKTDDGPLLVTGDASNVGPMVAPGGAAFSESHGGKKIVFHAFKNGKDIKDGRAMFTADIEFSGNIMIVK